MDKEIEVLEGLVGALVKAKDLIDNHSQTEIEILKAKCEKEEESLKATFKQLTKFFTEHWDKLQGDRLNGGIWKNDYLCGSPMCFGSRIFLVRSDTSNYVKNIELSCDATYELKKRNNIVHTPLCPCANEQNVKTIDYWTQLWETLKWERLNIEEIVRLTKKELARLVNNQL